MSRLKDFLAWARSLDERILGPGGFVPDGMGYFEYQKATASASESPRWVPFGRWSAIVVMFAALRLLDGYFQGAVFGLAFLTGAALTVKADRDLRIAARAGTLAARRAGTGTNPR